MRYVMALVLLGGVAFAKEEPCQVATEGDSPVAQACAAGGRDAAKKKMKEFVKAAHKNGADFKCGNCHVDTKTFKLKDNAHDDFDKLVEAATGK
jgi:hypothetical protein